MVGQKGKSKALNQVITTLILLVVAVLLAGVVTYYATNVTMTRTESEEIKITKAHAWVNSTGSVAAFKIQNLGGRDILLDKVSVRGVPSAWTDVWFYRVPSGSSVTGDLNRITSDDLDAATETIDGNTYTRASADIPLMSGGEMIVYIKDPGNLQVDDIGTSVSISVFTASAQYIYECNAESGITQ